MIFSAQITVILLHKLNLRNNRKEPSFFSSHYWALHQQDWPVWRHILLFWAAATGVLNRLQKIAEGNLKPAVRAIWWHEAPGLFLKWVVIRSLLRGAGPRATGGFDRQTRQPIESLLLRQRTNQRPSNFHEATGASVRSRWTSSIMCGRPNGTEFGCVSNTQKAPSACVTLLRH